MHFRPPRLPTSALWVTVLALVILGGDLSRVRHGNSEQRQTLEQLETRARVARKAVERSSHLLNAVQQTARSCGLGSNAVVGKIEIVLRQRVAKREAQSSIAEARVWEEKNRQLMEELAKFKMRLLMLAATNAGPGLRL